MASSIRTLVRLRSSAPLRHLHHRRRRLLSSTGMLTPPAFKQEPHKLLVIPGPIEVADQVLYANASPSVSHVSPAFSNIFQSALSMLLQVLYAPNSQPFITAGSGTLGWDMVAANLVERGEQCLVLHSGYFGDSFSDCLQAYGANVTQLKASLGSAVQPNQLEQALEGKSYKLVTITHVDTSTGVLSDVKALAQVIRKVSPDTLIVLDAVCSVGSEEIKMEEWGIDVVLSASQKGLGVPPGLCVLVASQKAIQVLEQRKEPVPAYFVSWKRWLPIMKAYQSGGAAYFATPPTNLITALETSLKMITTQKPTLEDRFKAHKETSLKIKQAIKQLGLKQLPVSDDQAANGMTAIWVPEGIKPTDILPKMLQKDVVVAAGLHKDVKEKYFRIGHMGITAIDQSRGDVDKIISALSQSLEEVGYEPSRL